MNQFHTPSFGDVFELNDTPSESPSPSQAVSGGVP